MALPVVGAVGGALGSIWLATLEVLPGLLTAILLLIVGFVLGKLIGRGIKELLIKANVDKHIAIKQEHLRLSNLFSVIIKWLIYLLFIQQASLALGIIAVADAFGMLVSFLPSMLEAIIVVVFGYVIAKYVEETVRESKLAYTGIMSKVFSFFIVYVAISIALPLVGLSDKLVTNILLIIVGSAGLGFALAFGLGMKHFFEDLGSDLGSHVKKTLKKK